MKKREPLTFELTPLIDVVFILLTFFLVATTMKKNETVLNIELPNYGNSSHENSSNMGYIELTNNSIAINGKIVPLDNFEEIVSKIDKNREISLYIEKKTYYERVSLVINILQKYNINKISFVQQK
ncbi:biopolymer transporter ExbD [bacterium]|nr:biopolymer transporter ExbD [bacterium]